MTRPELERLEGVVHAEKLSRPELDGRAIADAWCLDETPDGWALFLRSEKGWPEGAPDVYRVLDDAVDALTDHPEPQRYSLLALDDGWAAGFLRENLVFDPRSLRRFVNEREAISFFIVRARLYLRSAMNQAARERGEL